MQQSLPRWFINSSRKSPLSSPLLDLRRQYHRRRRSVTSQSHHDSDDTLQRQDGETLQSAASASSSTTPIFDPYRLDPSLLSSLSSCMEDASLSPFLPVPDAVAFQMLTLAQVGPSDVHYELGSGDGRVNRHAIQEPFQVSKSIGIEIDQRLIVLSQELLEQQNHPRSHVVHYRLADLMNAQHDVWKTMEEDATVVTMYFVEHALRNIRQSLTRVLHNSSHCRIVTCGYPIPDWKPQQVQHHHLGGLTMYLYMKS